MSVETIGLGLTTISALGALLAAIGAWRSAHASRVAAEAPFFSNQLGEYSAEKMLYALRTLRNWKAEKGDDFEIKWRQAIESDVPVAQEVDRAQRAVKFYFYKALRLYQSGYVSKRFLKTSAPWTASTSYMISWSLWNTPSTPDTIKAVTTAYDESAVALELAD